VARIVSEPVEMQVQLVKIQTMANGTVRYTIDAQEGHILETAQMMVFLGDGGAGKMVFTPQDEEDWGDYDPEYEDA